MTEIVSELKLLEAGLEVRVSMLSESAARYFTKDQERLKRLIDRLSVQVPEEGDK